MIIILIYIVSNEASEPRLYITYGTEAVYAERRCQGMRCQGNAADEACQTPGKDAVEHFVKLRSIFTGLHMKHATASSC